MLTNIIESLIFAAAKGVTKATLKEAFGQEHTVKEIENCIEEIRARYSGDSGIILIEFNNTYQFQTNPKYSDVIADLLVPIKERQLTQTVLQTLSIIAYSQPITRTEIETIRSGVSSDYAIGVLMKAELIEIKGRRDTPGRPALYGTTDKFLKHFQLRNLRDLPSYDELMQDIRKNNKYNKASKNLYAIKNEALYTGEGEEQYLEERAEEAHEFLSGNETAETPITDNAEAYACALSLETEQINEVAATEDNSENTEE